MTTEIIDYKEWLRDNVTLENPFSASSLRVMMKNLLLGRNYRLLTEQNTRERLFTTYAWLLDIYDKAHSTYGSNWRSKLLDDLLQIENKTPDKRNLTLWLLGLTKKTCSNLDICPQDYVEFLKETIQYCDKLFKAIDKEEQIDDAWLLFMAGHATLNIRGSTKSTIGKKLEKSFAKTALTLLGFEHNKNFWSNIERDEEVEREADAEVASKRGRIRIEMGLISSGNQEVIEDKISRVGPLGIVICDKLGAKSRVYTTAEHGRVKLIQIRNNQPLVELYNYLISKVDIKMQEPPTTEQEIQRRLDALPDEFFVVPI
ncbi:MAG: CfrBI family restriction endonuclease [Candidatus Bathyarchaeota archaeon]|nr:CfrBI family restriction endonuclease [Candidatus Bathyarchaeota archaeon]